MREIKFRGKSKDTGEWIEGYYGFKDLTDEHFIIVPTFDSQGNSSRPQYFTDYLVEPETVGQCTGLKDKNGKEIYEGDIVNAIGMYPDIVIFKDGTFRLDGGSPSIVEDYEHYGEFEVVGNKYENK